MQICNHISRREFMKHQMDNEKNSYSKNSQNYLWETALF